VKLQKELILLKEGLHLRVEISLVSFPLLFILDWDASR